jgi:hypothetical protein
MCEALNYLIYYQIWASAFGEGANWRSVDKYENIHMKPAEIQMAWISNYIFEALVTK